MTDRASKATTSDAKKTSHGAIAQLGERLLCTQEVGGSIPPGSTITSNDKNFETEPWLGFLLFNNLNKF